MPAHRESAFIILDAFAARGCKAGDSLPAEVVASSFERMDRRTHAGFERGLRYAMQQGWLEKPSDDILAITDAGFRA